MFFPRKSDIFKKLIEQSSKLNDAAKWLVSIANDWDRLTDGTVRLKEIEHDADVLVHTIKEDIEKIFVLPLDKEDIAELAEHLDDIVDNIEEVVNRLGIYRITEGNKTLKRFSDLILQATEEIHNAMGMIEKRELTTTNFAASIKLLRDLEAQGDDLHRDVLRKLMGTPNKSLPVENTCLFILKWKEIYQTLENTLDTCDNIARLFSKLRIKYT